MKRFFSIWLSVLCCALLSADLSAQCTSSTKGGVFINEFGNTDNDNGKETEFVELVVLADPSAPFQNIDLTGWILDDNNAAAASVGNEPGHVVLGDCFSDIAAGTIILIYNDEKGFPGIDPALDGMPNANGVYQIPFSDACLIKIDGCPNQEDSNYSSCKESIKDFGYNPSLWSDYIPMRNVGDAIQLRRPGGELAHALYWIAEPNGFPDANSEFALALPYNEVWNSSVNLFSGSDWQNVGNYVKQAVFSPGAPNSPDNQAFIENIQPALCDGESVQLGCPDEGKLCYVWSPTEGLDDPYIAQPTASPSTTTTYTLTVIDADEGDIIRTEEFLVQVADPINVSLTASAEAICNGEAVNLGLTVFDGANLGDYNYEWSTGSTESSILVVDAGVYWVKIIDPNTDCSLSFSQEIKSSDPSLEIFASEDILCENPIDLTAVVGNTAGLTYTYNWSTGETANVISVNEPAVYSVTITLTNGCSVSEVFEIQSPIGVELTATSDKTCEEEPATLEIVPAPGIDPATFATYQFLWSTGETSAAIQPIEAGSYGVTISSPSGCMIVRDTILDPCRIKCEVEPEDLEVDCQVDPTIVIDENTELITDLQAEDSFWAGDFVVKVTEARGSNLFFGEGTIDVPYINQAKARVKLKNVQINAACQMVAGKVEVEGITLAFIDAELTALLDSFLNTLTLIDGVLADVTEIMEAINEVLNQSEVLGGYMSDGWNLFQGVDPIREEYPYLADSLLQNLQDAIDCFNHHPPDRCRQELADALAALQTALEDMFDASRQIVFLEDETQDYGFDAILYDSMIVHYNKLVIAGDDYVVPWKSVATGGETDMVLGDDPSSDQFPDNIVFEDNQANSIPTEVLGDKRRLTVQGGENNEVTQVYAVEEIETDTTLELKYAGKLNVISYDHIERNVVIVPVNGASTSYIAANIEERINEIYAPSLASFSVSFHSNIDVPGFNGELDSTGTAFLSAYNSEMLKIRRHFKNNSPSYNSNDYYIFLVDDAENPNMDGYMPKKRQFGFVINSHLTSFEEFSRTVAHELGHGVFVLEHTFDEFPSLDQGDTDNLMDYGTGTRLHKYQWHTIHNPPANNTLGDDQDEAQQLTVQIKEIFLDYVVDGYLTFYGAYGQPVSVPYDQILDLTFATGGETFVSDISQGATFIPIGTLTQFTLQEGIEQVHWRGCADGKYYDNVSPGGTQCIGNIYDYPIPDSIIQIVVRHALKEGDDIIHFVAGDQIAHPGMPPEGSDFLPYDHFLTTFFSGTGEDYTIVQPQNIVEVQPDVVLLDEIFGKDIYLDFVAEYPLEAEYQRLSSFYISGLAVLVESLSEAATSCDENRNAVNILLSALTLTLNPLAYDPASLVTPSSYESSLVDNLLSSLRNNQYYAQSGLSETEVTEKIISVLKKTSVVDYYNDAIAQINGDVAKADIIVDDFYSQNRWLLPCEWDLLIFPDYEDLELLIKRTFIEANASGFTTPSWVNNEEEWILLRLINKIQPDKYADFIHALENDTDAYGDYYWIDFVEGLDDSMFDDNGLTFIRTLQEMFAHEMAREGSELKMRGAELAAKVELAYQTGNDFCNGEELSNLDLPIIPYNYKTYLSRINFGTFFKCLGGPQYCAMYGNIIPETQITDVYASHYDGTLTAYQRNKLVFYIKSTDNEGSIRNIRPFDPIILDENSTFGDAKKFITEKYSIVPAITLYYLEENASTKTIQDVAFNVIDVATLAIPITKITTIGKVVGYLDKASSILSIAATYSEDAADLPEGTTQFLQLSSALLGLADITHTGIVKLKGANQKVELLNRLSKTYTSGTGGLVERDNYLALLEAIENYSDAQLAAFLENHRSFTSRILLTHKEAHLGQAGITEARVSAAITRLGFNQLDVIRLEVKNALAALTPTVSESTLPDLVINLSSVDEAIALRNLLLADDAALLKSFHLSTVDGGYPNLVAWWQIVKDNHPNLFAKVFGDGEDAFDLIKRKAFFEDIAEIQVLRSFFNGDLNAVKTWEALFNIPQARKDIKWLESGKRLYDDGLINNIPEVLIEETISLHRYTVSSFKLNGSLNTGRPLTQLETIWQGLLRSAVNKLQSTSRKYVGQVYRGQSLPEQLILDKYVYPYQQGAALGGPVYVTENAFISTTKSADIADEFIQKSLLRGGEDPSKRPVLFHITSKSGVDIDDVSYYGINYCSSNPLCTDVQEEVFLIDGLTFRIQNVEITDADGFNVYEIFLEEF